MKLKEILVQELPKRGGWPKGAEYAFFNDVQIGFYMGNRASFFPEWTTGIAVSPCKSGVTKEQYEAALAASKKVEWDGIGLPPVGCECEVAQSGQFVWDKFKVIAVAGGAVFGLLNNVSAVALDVDTWSFCPIRSEADKKRDAAIELMIEAYFKAPPIDEPNEYDKLAMHQLYEAIAAGKIPGVRIE